MKKAMTRAELLALPASTNMATLADAFGISEPVARERHRRGEFEAMGIRVLRLGAQWRVVTADLLSVLGIEPGSAPQMTTVGSATDPTAPINDQQPPRELRRVQGNPAA